jgi:hypothetical protein
MMSNTWIPKTIAGFRIKRMSRAERIRRKAEGMVEANPRRAIAALVPAVAAGVIAVVRMRRKKNSSAWGSR